MSSVPPPPPPPPFGGDQGPGPTPGGPAIQNYLVLNIIATVVGVFCCDLIGGIPAIIGIVMATQVTKLAEAGDIAGAQSKANTAKILAIVSLALGGLGLVLNIIGFATGSFNYNFSTN